MSEQFGEKERERQTESSDWDKTLKARLTMECISFIKLNYTYIWKQLNIYFQSLSHSMVEKRECVKWNVCDVVLATFHETEISVDKIPFHSEISD